MRVGLWLPAVAIDQWDAVRESCGKRDPKWVGNPCKGRKASPGDAHVGPTTSRGERKLREVLAEYPPLLANALVRSCLTNKQASRNPVLGRHGLRPPSGRTRPSGPRCRG